MHCLSKEKDFIHLGSFLHTSNDCDPILPQEQPAVFSNNDVLHVVWEPV
jgi:hypothetical protein